MDERTRTSTLAGDIPLSEKGKSWLRREALKKFAKLECFCEAVGKNHVKSIQGKSVERAIQRMLGRNGKLTRSSLYLEAIAGALEYPSEEVETVLLSGREPKGDGRYILPERSMQFAISLLVKLRTYRIAQDVDLKRDELPRVYEAAYRLFLAIREMLESYPADELRSSPLSQQLFDLTIEILNEGLRPHLTEWRSRFMTWFEKSRTEAIAARECIQQTQIRFPEIKALEKDLAATSLRLADFRKTLEELVMSGPS